MYNNESRRQRRRHNCRPNEIGENLEDITVFWLDSNANDAFENCDTQIILENFTNCLLIYTNPVDCMNCIREITKERILLIISGVLSQYVLPQIHPLPTITAIFIFCSNRKTYLPLLSQYSKITDVFTEQNSLMLSIRKTIHFISKQALTFSTLNHQKQKATRDASKDFGSFVWFQLLIDILRKIPQSDRSKQDMLDKCREYYALNQIEMRKIEQFELTYDVNQAIEWYTRNSFVYRLVNKALRTEDAEIIYIFRFYIFDLCSQLEYEWKRLNKENNQILKLYRGQRVSVEEYNKLIHSINSFISTNGFFSTTKNIDVALEFLGSSTTELKTILFEITADCHLQTVVFADIDPYSHADGEQEVLFSLAAVFKIDNAIFDSPLYSCKIQMTATDERSNDIQDYLNTKRQQLNDYTPTILFGRLLLLELGQLDKAEKYFRMLMKTLSPDHEDFASACNNLGIALYGKRRFNLGLECVVQAYILRRQNLHPQHPATAASLMNIGIILHSKKHYDEATFCLEKALKIFENNYHSDHQLKAIAMNSIGLLYRDKKECQIALKYFNRALGMYQRILPSQHPDTASCLGNIGLIYEDLKDYEQALAYYYRAFEIDKKILPFDHPNLMDDFNRIIDIYMEKGEDQNTMELCRRIITEFEDTLLSAHALKNLSDFTLNAVERIDYYKKALIIFEKSLNSTDLILIYCLIGISRSCWECNMFDDALNYQLQALDKQQRISYTKPLELILSLENTGRLYYNRQRWQDAVNYFEKAKTILKLNIDINHEYINEIDNLITLAKHNENTKMNVRRTVLDVIRKTHKCHSKEKKNATR